MIKIIFILISILFFGFNVSAAQIKVACVGNSITQGWGGNPSFVPILQKLLGDDYKVENFGKSGATVLKKGDKPYWNQSAYKNALKSNADIMTIMLGANDAKSKNWDKHNGQFEGDYAALVDALQSANKNAKIYLVIPTPTCKDNFGIKNTNTKKQIPIVKKIANEKGLSTIDANTPLLDKCDYFADGVHPKKSGAEAIANIFSKAIKGTTHSIVDVALPTDKQRVKGVYPVFNGNISSVFADLIPGVQYELSAFSVSGVLIGKTVVNASINSQSSINKMFAQPNTMRLFTVKKVNKEVLRMK